MLQSKDPAAGNLDRIQIVKGWVDKKGNRFERIYDVAVSDGRSIESSGACLHKPYLVHTLKNRIAKS